MQKPNSIKDLRAISGERVLPKWRKMLDFVRSTDIVPGPGFRITRLPQGTIVTPNTSAAPWRHPWKVGTSFSEELKEVYVGDGTVNNLVPWVSASARLGDDDKETGQRKGVPVEPQREGKSWIAVGVNVMANAEEYAGLEDDPTFASLRVAEIKELPKGRGYGGVIPDEDGWAWYALARYEWKDERVVRSFQIVYHNLSHSVVGSGPTGSIEKHFFFST